MLKKIVPFASCAVFLICFYVFLLGNEVFAGKFRNDYFSWYFLAKGIFCSLTLYILGLFLKKKEEK